MGHSSRIYLPAHPASALVPEAVNEFAATATAEIYGVYGTAVDAAPSAHWQLSPVVVAAV